MPAVRGLKVKDDVKAAAAGSRQNVGAGSYSACRISTIRSMTDASVWSLRRPAR
jgi:hypothetical protein